MSSIGGRVRFILRDVPFATRRHNDGLRVCVALPSLLNLLSFRM